MHRLIAVIGALGAMLFAAPAAQAEVTSVFGERVPCEQKADGLRFCQGSIEKRVPTFDGIPLDANVTLPAAPAEGPDGDYPLIIQLHGYGGRKSGFEGTKRWAERGYAVLSYTARGFGDSCGSLKSRATAACARGWIHLADSRYEARDSQYLAGLLADEETGEDDFLIDPQRVGVTGVSYGGGQSMELAALKDRIMKLDGTLEPWKSPSGKPMQIAAAAPEIPWSDLAYSLVPNGRTLDYRADNPYGRRIGVEKLSFVSGLYALGQASSGYYAPPGADPRADLTTWFASINAGEPYDGRRDIEGIVNEITRYHSAYYIDNSRAPAPLFIANGFTDDLFPVDEAIRFENRTRAKHSEADAPISLMFLDYGHQRGQNKANDLALKNERIEAWFDYYLKGRQGDEPSHGVEALTQTCGKEAPSEGPFSAGSWNALSPGEVRFSGAGEKTIVSSAGDPATARAFDPIAGGGACATTSAADQPGTATYRLPKLAGKSYTLMGSPTVIADIASPFPNAQIAARLLDVAPDGTQRLVARALYRPDSSGRQVFQLHANGYKFEDGHQAKLELLGKDEPYGRPSNGAFTVGVSNLELRLPVLDEPDGETVLEPKDDFTPGAGGGGGGGGGGDTVSCEGRPATITGTPGSDDIEGTPGPDVIAARGGDDDIEGRAGDDLICAGRGDDRMDGGRGVDRIFGHRGADAMRGGADDDRLKAGTGDDRVRGGKDADRLRGGSGDDDLEGGGGSDRLKGGGDRDRLSGDSGRDTLDGDRDRDRCDGGGGKHDRARSCERTTGVP